MSKDAASMSCDQLWHARNVIYARNGYCFRTPRALATFGRGCFPPYGELGGWDERDGLFAKYPNLAARIQATHERFDAGSKRGPGTLYESWINALATQWAADVSAPIVSGQLWDAKRLQTGLASWATLRHSTILVNDQTSAECGEGGGHC